jgi:hypothetical protein
MTNEELEIFADACRQIVKNTDSWKKDYIYDKHKNEFRHITEPEDKTPLVKDWFNLD